jgi:hypothetical protein
MAHSQPRVPSSYSPLLLCSLILLPGTDTVLAIALVTLFELVPCATLVYLLRQPVSGENFFQDLIWCRYSPTGESTTASPATRSSQNHSDIPLTAAGPDKSSSHIGSNVAGNRGSTMSRAASANMLGKQKLMQERRLSTQQPGSVIGPDERRLSVQQPGSNIGPDAV